MTSPALSTADHKRIVREQLAKLAAFKAKWPSDHHERIGWACMTDKIITHLKALADAGELGKCCAECGADISHFTGTQVTRTSCDYCLEMSDDRSAVRAMFPLAYAKQGTITLRWYVFESSVAEGRDCHLSAHACLNEAEAWASARDYVEQLIAHNAKQTMDAIEARWGVRNA